MYQRFKRQLLDEMEMRRDVMVLKASEPSLEPIFEVSSFDDKLYKRILNEFDMIAVRHAEDLLYDLCVKYKIKAEKAVNLYPFDLKMTINGQSCCIELKTSPRVFNADSYRRFIDCVQNSQQPVYPVDLLGLTSLQVFEPAIYSKLPSYKETLCGSNHSYSYEQQKNDEEKVKKVIALIISNDGTISNMEAANNILGILFPRTKTIIGLPYGTGRNYSYQDFLINNNIAAPECFDRYFALTLENDAIPTTLIKSLIYESTEDELNEGIMQLYKEGKVIRLLEEIAAYANREHSLVIPIERASLIITALTRNWSSFKVDDRGFFSIPFVWRLLFCIDPLLKAMDATSRFSCIHSVFEDKNVQPSTLALLRKLIQE